MSVGRLAALLVAVALVAPAATAQQPPLARDGATHAVPLHGELVRPFDAPLDDPFAPGHRGIDVAAPTGTPVRSSALGTVAFSGTVVGNLTVTVDHGGGLRTTYSYLGSAAVKQGDAVEGGEIVGTVGRGHDESLPPHVHLSARRDGVYFDPLELYVGRSYADLIALVG